LWRNQGKPLFSPTTSSVAPKELLASLLSDAIEEGVQIKSNSRYLRRSGKRSIQTSDGIYEAKYLINTAGPYADKIGTAFRQK
jgi:L-2-hydroxyglutarate oxidase LhgO